MYFRLIFILPILILSGLVFFFMRGLNQDPHLLPSTLLNQSAPNFKLHGLLNPHHIYDQSIFQHHLTILTVWASWCDSCMDEANVLQKLHKHYPHIQFIGLDEKDNRSKALAFLKRYGNPYHIIVQDTEDGETAINYGVYGTPESFLIDQNGVIVAKQVGALTEENFETSFGLFVTSSNHATAHASAVAH